MRKLFSIITILILLLMTVGTSFARNGSDVPEQVVIGADQAFVLLKEGNQRFVKGSSVYPNQTSHQRKILALKGQQPFATMVTGSDSRVDPVLIFDRGLGDLYTIRTAGSVAGTDTLASVEYSMLALETPLLVVMGHTRSSLIKAAVENIPTKGYLVQLVGKLEPAIKMTKVMYPSLEGNELIAKVAETNVRQVIRDILGNCPGVLEKIRSGKAQVMGAVYDTDTGAVRWLGP